MRLGSAFCIHSAYRCPAQNRATNATHHYCKRVGRTTRFCFVDGEAAGETACYAVEDSYLENGRPADRSNARLTGGFQLIVRTEFRLAARKFGLEVSVHAGLPDSQVGERIGGELLFATA